MVDPQFAPNPNTGEAFGSGYTSVPATQTILHDANHPSAHFCGGRLHRVVAGQVADDDVGVEGDGFHRIGLCAGSATGPCDCSLGPLLHFFEADRCAAGAERTREGIDIVQRLEDEAVALYGLAENHAGAEAEVVVAHLEVRLVGDGPGGIGGFDEASECGELLVGVLRAPDQLRESWIGSRPRARCCPAHRPPHPRPRLPPSQD